MTEPPPSRLNPTTPEVIAEALALLAAANHAALATHDPADNWPLASRVGLAILPDGTPLILVSGLAEHAAALAADPRCALLVGEVGKGDPLAHKRLMVRCRAEAIPPGSAEAGLARASYLARHPKAALHVDLPDFRFLRLVPVTARFNAGFGRAYALDGPDLGMPR